MFVIKCRDCDYSERTESYNRAKDLSKHHLLVTYHQPVIGER